MSDFERRFHAMLRRAEEHARRERQRFEGDLSDEAEVLLGGRALFLAMADDAATPESAARARASADETLADLTAAAARAGVPIRGRGLA